MSKNFLFLLLKHLYPTNEKLADFCKFFGFMYHLERFWALQYRLFSVNFCRLLLCWSFLRLVLYRYFIAFREINQVPRTLINFFLQIQSHELQSPWHQLNINRTLQIMYHFNLLWLLNLCHSFVSWIFLGPRLTRRVPYSNHSVLLSVCPSFCPSVRQKTLTLAITFLHLKISLSYLACVILMTRPFQWYHEFGTCDLDRDLWPTFEKL